MYDEPVIGSKELIDRRSPDRLRPGSPLRALAAGVPALGAVFWFSALLGVGPMDGHEAAGLLVTIVAFGLWQLAIGRNLKPR